jgi:hypothetical protein
MPHAALFIKCRGGEPHSSQQRNAATVISTNSHPEKTAAALAR